MATYTHDTDNRMIAHVTVQVTDQDGHTTTSRGHWMALHRAKTMALAKVRQRTTEHAISVGVEVYYGRGQKVMETVYSSHDPDLLFCWIWIPSQRREVTILLNK